MSQPSWLNQPQPAVQTGPVAPQGVTLESATQATTGFINRHEGCVKYTSRVINMGLAVMMAASAVLGLLQIENGRIDLFFVAIYMLIFAAILFLFELSQFRYIEWIDRLFKRNFGFLYGSRGKSLYLIFIAFMTFGLIQKMESLQLAAAILMAIDGIISLLFTCLHPGIFDAVKPEPKPTTGV